MRGWKQVSISDMGRVVTGNTPPRKNPELYGDHTIFIKPTDISEDQKYTYSPDECYSDLGFKKYKNSLIPKGATCVVTIGSIGKKMTKAHCDCFINQAVNAVIPFPNFDDEFVYYVLKYNLGQLKGLDSGTASGRENVSKSSFSSIKINVPVEKYIQARIGKILSAYDDLIENNLKRIKLLEELAQRTYEEWFVKFRVNGEDLVIDGEIGLPVGWEYAGFSKYFTIHNGHAFKSEQYTSYGVKILRTRDYSQSKWIEISDTVCISKTEALSYSKYLVRPYDVMLIMVGASIGNYGVVLPKDSGLLQNQNQWAIRSKHNDIEFYKISMMETLIKKLLSKKTGSARDFFRASFLNEMKVIIPCRNLLTKYNLIMDPLYSQINSCFRQNALLKQSREILLPRLMNGTINISNAGENFVMAAEPTLSYNKP